MLHPRETFLDLPRAPVLAISAVFAGAVAAVGDRSATWLLSAALLIPFAAVLDGAAQGVRDGGRAAYRRAIAFLYFFSNELGCFVSFLRHREVGLSATRLHFGRNQRYGEWVDAGRRVRSMMAAWLVLLIAAAAAS